ncbi:MAG: M48 family metalloprotease [Calditrichaeota bacterium]|nr:M48 family metalloprotease [Calditrichota bacterium]
MGRNHSAIKWFLILLGLAFLLGCAVNPVTGKRELILLSEADEIQLGIQTDRQLVQMYGIYDDPELQLYIQQLGQKLAALSHRPHLDYQFKLTDTPVINAFAVPGGFVYITRGILAYLNSEAELAGVIGHEIGHIAARHSAKQYTRIQLAQLGLGLGAMLSEQFARFSGLAEIGLGLLFLKFSRDQEKQADELGVEYAARAGYDASEMANFFLTLDRMTPEEQKGGLPSWFSTHPNPRDRVVKIRQLARNWVQKLGLTQPHIERQTYLKKIDGIVFGEDPRQGFVRKGYFYHPDLKFQFPVPRGWEVQNTPTQVRLVEPGERAAILFTIADANSPRQAADQFVRKEKALVLSNTASRINGFPAQILLSEIASSDQIIRILSYFIRKGKVVFVFHGFTRGDLFPQFQSTFEHTMANFKVLRDRSLLSIQPDRIEVRRVQRAAPLRVVLKRWRILENDLETTALINGLKLTDTVEAGTWLKTIRRGK